MTTYPKRYLIDAISLLRIKQNKRASMNELKILELEELIRIQEEEIYMYNAYIERLKKDEEYREDLLK